MFRNATVSTTLLLMTFGCLAPEYTEPGLVVATSSAGSTIAFEAAAERVWLTSPDDDRVIALDAESLQQCRERAGPPRLGAACSRGRGGSRPPWHADGLQAQ